MRLRGPILLPAAVCLIGSLVSAQEADCFAASGTTRAENGFTNQRLNTTGHRIVLTVPATIGATYLGDISLTIEADDTMTVPVPRLLDFLAAAVNPAAMDKVRQSLNGKQTVELGALTDNGILMHYDAQKIELRLDVPVQMRLAQTLQVAPSGGEPFGDYEKPAPLSAYLNIRGLASYVEQGGNGLAPPVFFTDGAARFHDVVLESAGTFQPGQIGSDFQRQGTRLVYDDEDDLLRWTLGDLLPVASGFQSAPQIAGISIFRSYSALQPQMIARPTGAQSFSLARPSIVEIWVNGQMVQRLQLEAGTYDLRNFPVTQGVADVHLVIQDDSGGRQDLHFNLFSTQSQLAEGLSEFGLYAGVRAPLGASGPVYTNDPELSGFFRHGLTNEWTVGANVQANAHAGMAGLQSILSTPFGAFSVDLAGSRTRKLGSGFASTLTFQTLMQRNDGTSDAIYLSAQAWTKNFAPIDTIAENSGINQPGAGTAAQSQGNGNIAVFPPLPDANSGANPAPAIVQLNPYQFQLGANYLHGFSDDVYAGLNLQYSKGRAPSPDGEILQAIVGWRPAPAIGINASAGYEHGMPGVHNGLLFQLNLSLQVDPESSVSASYDSSQQVARLGYQIQQGQGAGSFNASATLEHMPQGIDVDGSATYLASEGELGADHFTAFAGSSQSQAISQSDVRVATSIAFADGAVSIGRPIYDSFAIVARNDNLGDADIVIDPTPFGYAAETTPLGTATVPDLMSYNQRTITIDAPDAPADADLGKGAFRLIAPYRAGYRLEAGSDYAVTAVGRMVDLDGHPLSLISGSATELANPQGSPIDLFTNREGRFGISGLRAGRWRIAMQSEPALTYELDILPGAKGALKVGDLKPLATGAAP